MPFGSAFDEKCLIKIIICHDLSTYWLLCDGG
jgi:hypothetical protein